MTGLHAVVAIGLGGALGALIGVGVARGLGGEPTGDVRSQAGACEAELHRTSTELLDLKEEVDEVRREWYALERDLGPIGGVPVWWRSQDHFVASRGAARARAIELGATDDDVNCDEDPCLIVLPPDAPDPKSEGELLIRGEGRAILAPPLSESPDPERVQRVAVRAARLLASTAGEGAE